MKKLEEKVEQSMNLIKTFPELLREVDKEVLERVQVLISYELLDRDLEEVGHDFEQ